MAAPTPFRGLVRHGGWRAALLISLSAALLSACSSGSSITSTSFNPTTLVPTTSGRTSPRGSSPAGSGASTSTTAGPSALVDAIIFYETSHTIDRSRYVITGVQVSSVDPSWAKFTIDPTPADRSTFQPGYGIVHLEGDTWKVIGFGSAEVGCPPGPSVPAGVLASLGLSCPSS